VAGELHDAVPGPKLQSYVAEQVTVLLRHPGPVNRGTNEEALQVRWQIEGIAIGLMDDPGEAFQCRKVPVPALPKLHGAMIARSNNVGSMTSNAGASGGMGGPPRVLVRGQTRPR
jgi:hypothetical protein